MENFGQISSQIKLNEDFFAQFNEIKLGDVKSSNDNYASLYPIRRHTTSVLKIPLNPINLINSNTNIATPQTVKCDSRKEWNPFEISEKEKQKLADFKFAVKQDKLRRKYIYESITKNDVIVKISNLSKEHTNKEIKDPFEGEIPKANLKSSTPMISQKRSNIFENPYEAKEQNKITKQAPDVKVQKNIPFNKHKAKPPPMPREYDPDDKYAPPRGTARYLKYYKAHPFTITDRKSDNHMEMSHGDHSSNCDLHAEYTKPQRGKSSKPNNFNHSSPYFSKYQDIDSNFYANRRFLRTKNATGGIKEFKDHFLNDNVKDKIIGETDLLKKEHKLAQEKYYLKYFVNHPEKIIPGTNIVFSGLKEAPQSPERIVYVVDQIYRGFKRFMDEC